jgi:hypothetical protein
MPRQTRTSPDRWKKILNATCDELSRLGASDVWVFGSQAMSLHMSERALASKDLDLLASGLSMKMVEQLCITLVRYSDGRRPNYSFQNPLYDGRSNPVFSISLKARNERPFVVELFQTYLGFPLTKLTPYATIVHRWNREFQTLTIEAVIATRLAFRPPERISPFNAARLNRFIQSVRSQKIDWRKVSTFAKDFQLEQRINENLEELARRHNLKIKGSDKLLFVS